jgi:hypothetical protein
MDPRYLKMPKFMCSRNNLISSRKSHDETEQEADKGNTDAPMPNQVKGDISRYVPPHRFIPYPQRLANTKLNKQYARFVELLK